MIDGRQKRSDSPQYGNRWLFVVLSLLTATLVLIVVVASWPSTPIVGHSEPKSGAARRSP